jgi:PAS domain S-box-containing protein
MLVNDSNNIDNTIIDSTKKGVEIVEDLSENLVKQELLFQQAPLGIIEWDTDFRVIRWNPRAERLFGYSEHDAMGKTVAELIVPDSAKSLVEGVWKKLLTSKGGTRSTNENVRKDGKIILCHWHNTPLVDECGKVIGVSSFVDDITESVKTEKIQSALYQISELVHTIDDIDQLYNEIHQIVSGLMKADNFYIALYDDENEMISFPYFVDEFDSPPEPCKIGRGLTEYVLRTGKNMLVDAELDLKLRKQGFTDLIGPPSEIWLGVSLKVKNKPIGLIVVQDYNDPSTYGEEEKQLLTYVSEQIASAIRKKMDEYSLKRYSEELKDLNASKDKFFSILAHDLRSPFHGLQGLASILKTEFDSLSIEEVKAYINEIQSATSNMFNLIENLLDWSRIQTGKYKFSQNKFSITQLICDIESVLKSTANLKSIVIKNEFNDENLIVTGDEEMIRSLMHNLLSNAIKFTVEKGRIELFYDLAEEGYLEIFVKDNGVGISKYNIPKLFRIDENYSTPGTNKEKGTGLGLLLCKEIVEKHGSELIAESELGQGSCFSFKLRLA